MRRVLIAIFAISIIIVISLAYVALQPPSKTIQISIAGVVLNVELARTPDEQQKGLSGRDSIPGNYGMLFLFTNEGQWSFWMHGMRFPLDIIWFDSVRRAVFIEQNLQPCGPDACPAYTPSANATYVLEVNAGFVAAHNLALGSMFTFISATPTLAVSSNI